MKTWTRSAPTLGTAAPLSQWKESEDLTEQTGGQELEPSSEDETSDNELSTRDYEEDSVNIQESLPISLQTGVTSHFPASRSNTASRESGREVHPKKKPHILEKVTFVHSSRA